MLKKPALDPYGTPFEWEAETGFPEELRRHVLRLATDGTSASNADAEAFMLALERWAQDIGSPTAETLAEQRAALELLSERAHATMVAINAMSRSARARMDSRAAEAPYSQRRLAAWPPGSVAVMRAGDGLLSGSWDVLQTLQQEASAAAAILGDHLANFPRYRAGESFGEGLCYAAAVEFMRIFERWPPHSQQSWFVEMMQAIGSHLGMECGPRVVAKAVKRARAEG